jgi:phosphoglycolate phosphatase-like HAD superfamily hydrolase
MIRAYIFDIDGTLADCSHRLHLIQQRPKDWRAFFAACQFDTPIQHMCELARKLATTTHIIFVSGRSDECRSQTEIWLQGQALLTNHLYMRKEGDHRDDDIIKLELLAQVRADGFDPIMVFDDRTRVVNAWRSVGIPCAQVAAGDF